MRFSLFILLFIIVSCNQREKHQDILKCVDKIALVHFKKVGTTTEYFANRNAITIYKEIINAKKEDLVPSMPAGLLKFYCDQSCVLTATIFPTGCKYVFETDTFKTRLTYQAGQFWMGY